jgi:hypothetical protein
VSQHRRLARPACLGQRQAQVAQRLGVVGPQPHRLAVGGLGVEQGVDIWELVSWSVEEEPVPGLMAVNTGAGGSGDTLLTQPS